MGPSEDIAEARQRSSHLQTSALQSQQLSRQQAWLAQTIHEMEKLNNSGILLPILVLGGLVVVMLLIGLFMACSPSALADAGTDSTLFQRMNFVGPTTVSHRGS